MLDTLLVLGQVPGTDFYITFSEVLLFLLVAILRWEEKRHRRQIRHQITWTRYRIGVNERRLKRLIRGYVRAQHYRLVLAIRQFKRDAKSYIRFQKRQLIKQILRTKRETILSIKRPYKLAIRMIELKIRRTKRKSRLAIRRRQRLIAYRYERRVRRLQRSYLGRALFRFKKSKLESPISPALKI